MRELLRPAHPEHLPVDDVEAHQNRVDVPVEGRAGQPVAESCVGIGTRFVDPRLNGSVGQLVVVGNFPEFVLK